MPAVMNAAATGAALDTGRFQPSVLNLDGFQDRPGKSLLKKVRKLVEDFPDQALQVVRGWMSEGA